MKQGYDFTNAKKGSVVPQKGKTRITIYIDNDVIEEFRARAEAVGYGYQTMINEALKQYLGKSEKGLDESMLRRVVREEIERAAHQ